MLILHGDARSLPLQANSIDAIVTDPPYGLEFMGKEWDKLARPKPGNLGGFADGNKPSFERVRRHLPSMQAWHETWAREALRVAKPGAHLLAFGGTRTHHRLMCALEDAGWEIRDCLGWLYGSGFPKSLDVSKQLDKQEMTRWLDVSKALDTLDEAVILKAWKEHSRTVTSAGLSFQKSGTATGMSTQGNGSVPVSVLLRAKPTSSNAHAIIAELLSSEAHHTDVAISCSVPSNVENGTTGLNVLVTIVERPPANHEATPSTEDSSVPLSAWGWLAGSAEGITKAAEALLTWLGSKPFLRQASIDVLSVELTDALKRIIANQSRRFLALDTKSQTAFVCATSATITESTGASLISFMVATLKSKAIDKAAGAEREPTGKYVVPLDSDAGNRGKVIRSLTQDGGCFGATAGKQGTVITAPATAAARQWQGWGTALKPAWEPIILARKSLSGTVAENVQRYGTGALNIDGCRIEAGWYDAPGDRGHDQNRTRASEYGLTAGRSSPLGRWPANLIHDGSEDVLAVFPQNTGPSGGKDDRGRTHVAFSMDSPRRETRKDNWGEPRDSLGSAARFFYCAKASRADRNEGLEDPGPQFKHGATLRKVADTDTRGNVHPCVKPTTLMRYLVRLITPPGGLVLDPFMGSGSTGKACALEGFRFLGLDLNAEYCQMAQARIDAMPMALGLEVTGLLEVAAHGFPVVVRGSE